MVYERSSNRRFGIRFEIIMLTMPLYQRITKSSNIVLYQLKQTKILLQRLKRQKKKGKQQLVYVIQSSKLK